MINYYVSFIAGDDLNDGRTEKTPFKTLRKASSISTRGDVVLNLQRGNIWYESLDTEQYAFMRNSLTIKPYGQGDMPTIRGCFKFTYNAISSVNNNIYAIDLSKCDGSKSTDRDIGFIYNKTTNKVYRKKKESKTELISNYDYFVDGDILYIYLDNSPKDELYFPHNSIGVSNLSYNSTLTGIRIELHGSLGVATTNTNNASKNININNCVIDLIGGSHISSGNGSLIPMGNGIQIFKGCENVKIYNNTIKRCYDVGFTCQGFDSIWKDIDVFNNIFEENGQSFEIWLSNTEGNTNHGIFNLNFRNNICKNNGNGWSKGITGKNCELLFYNLDLPNIDVDIHDNIFFNPNSLYHWAVHSDLWKSHDNIIFIKENSKLLHGSELYYANNFDKFIRETGKETESKLITIPNDNYKNSNNINLINSLFNLYKEKKTVQSIDLDTQQKDTIFQFKSNDDKYPYWVKICQVTLSQDHSNCVHRLIFTELEKRTFESCTVLFSAVLDDINSSIVGKIKFVSVDSNNVYLNSSNFKVVNKQETKTVELWFKYTEPFITLCGKYEFIGGIKSGMGYDFSIQEHYSEIEPA